MGYCLDTRGVDALILHWRREGRTVYAPKVFAGGGTFSDVDCIRYAPVESVDEIVFDRKSDYSFKECLLPVTERLFNFTGDQHQEVDESRKSVIFLHSCDLHGAKRLNDIYLKNGENDYYYRRSRNGALFVLMGCAQAWESCFCVDMGTNRSDDYDLSIDLADGNYLLDCKLESLAPTLAALALRELPVTPASVEVTPTRVSIPADLSAAVADSSIWKEYDSRCIACGRCNFVCPSCSCFTMQDLAYAENGNNGERRRVWASCMVDGFTDVAGGRSYRKNNGERMRFKTLHKVLDHRKRFGFDMCIGCGRCDDICPEYISFSHIINRLAEAVAETAPAKGGDDDGQ